MTTTYTVEEHFTQPTTKQTEVLDWIRANDLNPDDIHTLAFNDGSGFVHAISADGEQIASFRPVAPFPDVQTTKGTP